MRLHCLIVASIARVPFIPLPYSDKVSGFLADVGLPARTLEEVHAGPLLASIDRSWDERCQVVETLDAHVPTLQARARETVATTLSALSDQAGANDPDSGTSG